MHRRLFLAAAPLALAGCGAGEPVWAPDDALARVAYRHDGPPALTLITVKNLGSGNGAHTGLMINASQRVMFDPAGSYGHASIPERNDLLYGITPEVEASYISYHSRVSFTTVVQRKEVPAATAEQAFRLAKTAGPVPKVQCTRAASRLISALPGFERVGTTWFPDELSDRFGELPGVSTREFNENDSSSLRDATRSVARQLEG
ncbi:hypothetical protein [Limimaricola pyoseonensis]|uniref:Lipoprotein n=1 Tax=Limimaricola pyoseonensis TaxID=521013 RepID=A0A1G7K091_9RHOB|nr:hypothetical protein [Limimaricola pyoseonensis]SDF30219.1 hypothetical protein SAMN04488567_0060 [Limimaricola pyoseonensis]